MTFDIITQRNPDFTVPSPVPVGNWLAHQIRLIQEDSKHVFPASAGSKRSWDKYNSVTHKDFCGFPRDWKQWTPNYNSMPFEKKRWTVREVLFNPPPNQMFTAWKVPEHFFKPEDELCTDLTNEIQRIKQSPDLDKASSVSSRSVSPSRRAGSKSAQSPVKSPPKLHRQMSVSQSVPRLPPVPEMKVGRSTRPLGVQRQYTKLPDMAKSQPEFGRVQRAATSIEEKEKELGKEDLDYTLQPEVVNRAQELMKSFPSTDKKVIEKIIRMAEKKKQLENSLKKTLLPDAKETVEKWLQTANEEERQVALKFFNSLAGAKLMGMSAEDQKKRLKQVLDTLESAGNGDSLSQKRPVEKAGHLRTLRLLDPKTRKERWMHTTWHHLPEYREKEHGNWSSHYIRPHAAVPRHFTIHPDWGSSA